MPILSGSCYTHRPRSGIAARRSPKLIVRAPVYIGALALTALTLWQVTGDGEAAEFEGWALVALYVILATFTVFE